MPGRGAPVNPTLLLWARERAGLSLEQAAERAHLTADRHGTPPAERLRAFETGEAFPSLTQAEQIAHAYRRPLVTFFLPAPPEEASTLTDYRTIDDHMGRTASPEFAALKLRIISMYDTLKEIALVDPPPECEYVGSISWPAAEGDVVTRMRTLLEIGENALVLRKTVQDAFTLLREKVQRLGVYVVVTGDLGSHHTKISPTEFRGIVISDREVPLVVINQNDSHSARIFTLIHELVHILLGNKGISNIGESFLPPEAHRVELFCNQVAADFLVPENLLKKELEIEQTEEILPLLEKLSNTFKVSRWVILRKLKNKGLFSTQAYDHAWNILRQQLELLPVARKQRSGGPSRNRLDSYRLGKKLLTRIIEAAEEGIIPYSQASLTLGLPPSRFERVMQQ